MAFADSDDWVAADFHPSLVAAMEEGALDFVRSDHVRVTGNARTVIRAPESRRYETLAPREAILPIYTTSMVDYPYAWAGAFRTSFVRELDLRFPEGLRTAEDRPWIWRLHMEGRSFQVVSQVGYFYRQESPSALTQIGDARQLEFFLAMDRVLDYLDQVRAPDSHHAKAYRQLLTILASQYQRRERLEAEVARELLRRAPLSVRRLEERLIQLAADGLDAGRAELLSSLTGRRIPASG
jgi:hypothetical protein